RLENPPGTPVAVVSPYSSSRHLKWTQSADILFLTHFDTHPRELRRTSANTFVFVDFSFRDGPYLDTNTTATTLTLSGTTGSVTVTASSTTGINNNQGFLTTDVGRIIRWLAPNGQWEWLTITARTSSTTVTATIESSDPSGTDATTEWRLGAWSDTTGWPEVCVFHQGRLWFGRTTSQPQTLWASRVSNFRNFQPSASDGTVSDDNAITLTIDSNQVNAIAWMVSSHRGLLLGTTGESWIIRSADDTTGISPLNAELVPQGSWGSDDAILPTRVGSSTLYVQSGQTAIRESAFNFDEDVFSANNITILSEHLFRLGVKRLAFSQAPIQTVWALLTNGTLAGFTFDKEQKVIAWHHHTIAGAGANVVDIAVIQHDTQNQLWMLVERTIDGNTVQYVEFMEEPFDAQLHTIEEAFFLDGALTYDGVPTTTVSGLTHLEGETVGVLADGATHPDKVVSGGAVTLDRSASKVQVGLRYSAETRTMPLEAPNREGSFISLGKTKRIHQVHVILAETVGALIGPEIGVLDRIPFRVPSDPMDTPVELFNGVKSLSLSSSYEEQARVRVVSDQPLPCTVLAIVMEGSVHGS
ncbi:MAG TPA: hypothetical protein VJ808_11510, partial [Gemmatimonadales bacterium]|nr:hypothetical protein [Gemmatimonadales bacterium]